MEAISIMKLKKENLLILSNGPYWESIFAKLCMTIGSYTNSSNRLEKEEKRKDKCS